MASLLGSKPNQVSTNGDLGTLAFQDSNAVNITGGVVDVSAGTAALPTLGTTGDPNTGVFFPAADTVAVATNGAERVRVDSNGNVGVGTTSPTQKLDVGGGLNISNTNWLSFGGANTIFSSAALSGLLIQSPSGANNIIFRNSAGAENMRIDSAGNVGIGFTPNANSGGRSLSISSFGSSSGLFPSVTLGASASDYGTVGYNQGFTNTANSYKYLTTDFSSIIKFDSGGFKFFTAPSGTAGNAITFTQAMTLHASGGLSLGNTTDAGAGNLRVNGKIKTGGYTVATLPAGVVGDRAYVTDALAPTYLGALVGGGAVTCPAFYNGTAWVSA